MVSVPSQRVRRISKLNELDLRVGAAQRVATFLALATLFMWWWLLSQKQPDVWLLGLASVLWPTFTLLYYLCRRHPRVGGAAVVLLCALGTVAAAFIGPMDTFMPLLVLPGLVAAGVFRSSMGLLLGIPFTVLLTNLSGVDTGGLILPELILVQLCLYAILVPKERVLAWSWQQSAEATHLAEQLRDRQGELNKTMAALHLAYQLLERSNRELALARQEAEEARRLKEQFVANVSHELRTPLNIILGFTEVMHRTPEIYGLPEWPPMLRMDVAEVWHSAQYISELVDDILELARVDALQMPVTREMTQLTDIVTETCALVGRLLRDKPVILSVQVPADLPPIPVDRTRIRQVLVNLLTNAARFTDSGRIEVRAECTSEEVIVSVADTGIGIPQHELDAIFDEFRQVDGQAERGGKGLGLAIAKRFVQLHGGRIWAESQIGVGSTFSFALPVQAKQVSRLRGTLEVEVGRRDTPKLVVLSEDEPGEAPAYLARHLEGYQVLTTRSHREMQALIMREHPAAVVVISVETGTLREVAQALPAGVPIIGFPLAAPQLKGGDGLFDAVLNKPVSQDILLRTVQRLATGRSLLVVDDDRGFVQLVRRLLSSCGEGFEVQWASDGQEALTRMESFMPDVVLVDIVMAPMDGISFARAMRTGQSGARVPIIAVTGATTVADSTRAREFVLSKRSGLRDAELIGLLRDALINVRADYLSGEPRF